MERKKHQKFDTIVIGMALFAMFFGAGNLIFPPYLGMTSGTDWFLGYFCFVLADVGLAFVTMLAMVNSDGRISGVTGVIGKVPAIILNTAVIVCIGPLLAIPRTAATTFEMSILPLLPHASSWIFSIIFFGLVFVLTIRPSKIVDIVGKFLTPLMFLALVVLIVAGIVNPLGEIVPDISTTVVKDGISAGYQAMDVLAALGFAIIIITAVDKKGYTENKERMKVTAFSCIVAGLLLCGIYGGLTYLGATVSGIYDAAMDQTALIVTITSSLMGQFGVIMLGVIVALACLTTAIGLTSAAGSYFENLTNGKLSYAKVVTAVTLLSLVLSNFGVRTIINFSSPILSIVYPTVVTLIVLSFFKKRITNRNLYRGAALVSFIVSALTVFITSGPAFNMLHSLPFSDYGFNWVAPTIIGGIIGAFIKTPISTKK